MLPAQRLQPLVPGDTQSTAWISRLTRLKLSRSALRHNLLTRQPFISAPCQPISQLLSHACQPFIDIFHRLVLARYPPYNRGFIAMPFAAFIPPGAVPTVTGVNADTSPAARLRAALDALRWSHDDLSGLTRASPSTVHRWARGAVVVPSPVLGWLEDLAAHLAAHPPPALRLRPPGNPMWISKFRARPVYD